MAEFVLYGYFRSSAAFRARIALNLKGIMPEMRYVHLLKDSGQQHGADYRALFEELVTAGFFGVGFGVREPAAAAA